jgi:hypothetical protein
VLFSSLNFFSFHSPRHRISELYFRRTPHCIRFALTAIPYDEIQFRRSFLFP